MSTYTERGNGRVAFWLIMIVLLAAGAVIISRFIPALLWATVLTILLYPGYKRVQARLGKWKFGDSVAALFVTVVTALLVIGPFLYLLTLGAIEVYNFASSIVLESDDGQVSLTNLAMQADNFVHPWAERFGVPDFSLNNYLDQNKQAIAEAISGPLGDIAKKLGMMVFTLVISFLTTFFMLRDSHRLLEPVTDLMPVPRAKCEEILSRMASTVRSVFWSVVFVALIQGIMCGIAYFFLKVPSPAAWWAMTTLAAMIPLLGAPVVFTPAALLLILTGQTTEGIILLVFGFGVVSNIDNFLRPFFISRGSNLHMMAIFFSLLGGVLTMGPIGLMAGPMLLTFILGMLEVLRESRKMAEEKEQLAQA